MTDLEAVRPHVEIIIWTKAKIAELKAVQANAEEAIKAELGDDEIGELDGDTVITWVSHKKRQLQQADLREAHPEIVEEFTSIVEARTFKVVAK